MRITDHRYARDLRRFNLAVRFIELEARTQTICTWTGLSGERIRNLAQSYGQTGQSAIRHRGPTPNQPALFLRSLQLRRESAALGGLLRLLDVIPMDHGRGRRNDLRIDWAERLCRAYEMFRYLVPLTPLSVDHAVLLASALSHDSDIQLIQCHECGCAILVDRYGSLRRVCEYCRGEVPLTEELSAVQSLHSLLESGLQRSLF